MNDQETAQIKTAVGDVGNLVNRGKQAVEDYKKGGASALVQDVTAAIPDAQKAFRDITAALPIIKEGYKTTEFWLVVGFLLVNCVLIAINHPLPFNVDALIAGVLSVYALLRTAHKSTVVAAAPAATPAAP
jgi:hypothetical protein